MRYVVGYSANARGQDAVHLAVALARGHGAAREYAEKAVAAAAPVDQSGKHQNQSTSNDTSGEAHQ